MCVGSRTCSGRSHTRPTRRPKAGSGPWDGRERLVVADLVDHVDEAGQIGDHQLAAAPFDDLLPRQVAELAGDFLAVGAHAAGDVGVLRGWCYDRPISRRALLARHADEL